MKKLLKVYIRVGQNMNIDNKLKWYKKRYISLNEIESLYQVKSYLELVEIINILENEQIINPIRNSDNGMYPSLYLKYRINEDENERKLMESEIKLLCHCFAINKYLKNIDKYKEHREILLDLDYFLKHNSDKLKNKLSKNERAFQIWRNEKMLDSSLTKSVISFNNLNDTLNYYLTPEPFFDYVPKVKSNMNILIVENKDPWYTLRKIMSEKKLDSINLFGITIDGLLYGEGNKITKENAIYEYEQNVVNEKVNFYYWGDIDFAGIDLFERVKKANKYCNMKLLDNLYTKMVQLSKDIDLKNILKNQRKVEGKIFFNELENPNTIIEIKEILECNKYIPQEILNYEELKKIIDEENESK